mmetsp:Transcript_28164/g.39607  ORF Transcript_28164/g.39607 Transcript_28164/m.39607 type:complete len:119 (+) Transcript_28164:173-529(+)
MLFVDDFIVEPPVPLVLIPWTSLEAAWSINTRFLRLSSWAQRTSTDTCTDGCGGADETGISLAEADVVLVSGGRRGTGGFFCARRHRYVLQELILLRSLALRMASHCILNPRIIVNNN